MGAPVALCRIGQVDHPADYGDFLVIGATVALCKDFGIIQFAKLQCLVIFSNMAQ